ncbi:MAG: hypothetical protein ACYCT0_08745 [Sulfobacillus sp.]
MPFSFLSTVRNNSIRTETLAFLCSLTLCVELTQTQVRTILLPAANAASDPVFHPTCIQIAQVVQNMAFREQVSLSLTPLGPVPLLGPFPQTIPCGSFEFTAAISVDSHFLTLILLTKGEFLIATQDTIFAVEAVGQPIVRLIYVNPLLKGQWSAKIESFCYGCIAILAPLAPSSSYPNRSFSSLAKITNNKITFGLTDDKGGTPNFIAQEGKPAHALRPSFWTRVFNPVLRKSES